MRMKYLEDEEEAQKRCIVRVHIGPLLHVVHLILHRRPVNQGKLYEKETHLCNIDVEPVKQRPQGTEHEDDKVHEDEPGYDGNLRCASVKLHTPLKHSQTRCLRGGDLIRYMSMLRKY